jgi:hypothetical protein
MADGCRLMLGMTVYVGPQAPCVGLPGTTTRTALLEQEGML